MRQAAGKQLVENDAEGVDIGRGRRRLAENLLGRSVGRRQRAILESGGFEIRVGRVLGGLGGVDRVGNQDLGDAEVEEFHAARGIDQQVRRLEIAMHDEVAMRQIDRLRNGEDQPDARCEIGADALAPGVDRLALHELQYEIRPPVRRDPAVEKAGDVRMLEARQDLALAQEAAQHRVRVHAALEELERHRLLEVTVGALGLPDLAHAAAPEKPLQAIGPDAVAWRSRGAAGSGRRGLERRAHQRRREAADALLEIALAGGGVGGEQLAQCGGELGIARREARESCFALGRSEIGDLLEARRAEAKRCGSGRDIALSVKQPAGGERRSRFGWSARIQAAGEGGCGLRHVARYELAAVSLAVWWKSK
jgi:hypothetical protein